MNEPWELGIEIVDGGRWERFPLAELRRVPTPYHDVLF